MGEDDPFQARHPQGEKRIGQGVDLLTAVSHEIGHLLGYDHSDGQHDLMAATRYAVMMLRHAATTKAYHNFRRKLVYPKFGIA